MDPLLFHEKEKITKEEIMSCAETKENWEAQSAVLSEDIEDFFEISIAVAAWNLVVAMYLTTIICIIKIKV